MVLEYVDGLVNYLVQLALSCLYAVFYPVTKLIQIIIGLIVYIWTSLVTFLNSLTGLFNNFYNFVTVFLYSILPTPVVYLILLGVLITFTYLIYSYLKDIEFMGNKI